MIPGKTSSITHSMSLWRMTAVTTTSVNDTLHPNQKKYPGMTRWDVLMEHINPNLRPFDAITLARYIGERLRPL